MTEKDLIAIRLSNQQITRHQCQTIEELVKWMLVMQSQEFAMAKWAIGLRMKGISEKDVDLAFNEGRILRTHVLRPTWHFVSPADIGWMIRLTAPKIRKTMGYYCEKMGIDKKIVNKAVQLLTKHLQGHQFMTREQLKKLFEASKIDTADERMALILMQAELDCVICSGPRIGNQFSYALMSERAGSQDTFSKEDALKELAGRYFNSRGPATLRDLSYWSGIPQKDARQAVEGLGKPFRKITVNGNDYYYNTDQPATAINTKASFLVPDYDEFGMSYKNKGAFNLRGRATLENLAATSGFPHHFVIDGKLSGHWTGTAIRRKQKVGTKPFEKLSGTAARKLQSAVKRYERFFNAGR